MLVSIGSDVYYRTLAGGVFHCERCRGDRPYRHRRGRRWFCLATLPPTPSTAQMVQHLRCVICHTCYRVELLAVPTIFFMQFMHCSGLPRRLAWPCSRPVVQLIQAARCWAIALIMSTGSPQPAQILGLPGARVCRWPLRPWPSSLRCWRIEWFLGRIVQVGLADGALD